MYNPTFTEIVFSSGFEPVSNSEVKDKSYITKQKRRIVAHQVFFWFSVFGFEII